MATIRYHRPPEAYHLPVEGLSPADLVSTWHAPRSGGRVHEGADLFAPRGTKVLSAVRGEVFRIRDGGLGGKSVTVIGEGPAFYYYAHLDGWAPGLREGQPVTAGQTLGFVGNTGNARSTPSHLHFGVYPILRARPGRPVDPIPLLRALGLPRAPPEEAPSQLPPSA
ncbi:MAG: M23 family metallopeptidase [Deltaproteobacteria bacterium]|nr:M23 family metallopeptidase [Deltaproteobacteria bacterium]